MTWFATGRQRDEWARCFKLASMWGKITPQQFIPRHLWAEDSAPAEDTRPKEVKQADFESGLRGFLKRLGWKGKKE